MGVTFGGTNQLRQRHWWVAENFGGVQLGLGQGEPSSTSSKDNMSTSSTGKTPQFGHSPHSRCSVTRLMGSGWKLLRCEVTPRLEFSQYTNCSDAKLLQTRCSFGRPMSRKLEVVIQQRDCFRRGSSAGTGQNAHPWIDHTTR